MGEIKSVKVDNWGVFFLQKLQNFFNKTDYCDLTLQFNDNSQLKVHRLVLSACTDYFNVLEQTCEMIDEILIMPFGLQADVIVPIVNFMYTGTLEFEISMYGRLLKTARDMNMTVLLKLLEAHKRAVETSQRPGPQTIRQPKAFPTRIVGTSPPKLVKRSYGNQDIEQRRVPVSAHQLKTLQIKPVGATTTMYYPATSQPVKVIPKYNTQSKMSIVKGPSRFECNDETTLPLESFDQFDEISYESKPLITANQNMEDFETLIPVQEQTFEQLRKGYTGNKRPASSISSLGSPPEKKPNIQDVKEYAEQQRMRKQIAAEYDDENEYDEVLDDEFHNDDDDDDYVPPVHLQKQMKKTPTTITTPMVIKQEKDQKPTIVVKDTIGSNVNHAKIISEVLKKYPHLVKNNKNIKLKIMAKSSTSPNQTQSIVIKQEPQTEGTSTQDLPRSITVNIPKGINIQTSQQSTRPTPQKTSAASPAPGTSLLKSSAAAANAANTPRRIDSKTMHALIAQGAENMTGPWLCLKCGINGRPISIPSYRGFRRHLINTHKEKIDPRLCEHCGWRSPNNLELFHHIKVQHDISPPAGYYFPPCTYCSSILMSKNALEAHIKREHPEKLAGQQMCMYCDAIFKDEDDLFSHMQNQHKEQAQKDGILDYTDDEDSFFESQPNTAVATQSSSEKIKILSSITISPQAAAKTVTKSNSRTTRNLSNVATGIAASLGLIDATDSHEIQYLEETEFAAGEGTAEPKFVNADGHIMELTPEQRDEIMSQLESQHEGGVLMVLNQESFEASVDESGQTSKMDTSTESLLAELTGETKTSEKRKAIIEKSKEPDQTDEENESQASAEQSAKEKEGDDDNDDDDDEKGDEHKKEDEEVEEKPEELEKPTKENDEKERTTADIEQAKEKLKLLAGDWSDDEEEEGETEESSAVMDKKTTKPIEFLESVDSKKKSTEKPAAAESLEKEESDREVIFEATTGPDKEDDGKASQETAAEKVEEDEETDKPDDNDEKETTTEERSETAEADKTVSDEVEKSEADEESAVDAGDESKEIEEDVDEKVEENKDLDTTDNEPEVSEKEPEEKTEKAVTKKSNGDKTKKTNSSDESKKKSDHISSLINEWGDDDDDEDL